MIAEFLKKDAKVALHVPPLASHLVRDYILDNIKMQALFYTKSKKF